MEYYYIIFIILYENTYIEHFINKINWINLSYSKLLYIYIYIYIYILYTIIYILYYYIYSIIILHENTYMEHFINKINCLNFFHSKFFLNKETLFKHIS